VPEIAGLKPLRHPKPCCSPENCATLELVISEMGERRAGVNRYSPCQICMSESQPLVRHWLQGAEDLGYS
jgi:hypothetical protein